MLIKNYRINNGLPNKMYIKDKITDYNSLEMKILNKKFNVNQ